jgi:hypothetical protein
MLHPPNRRRNRQVRACAGFALAAVLLLHGCTPYGEDAPLYRPSTTSEVIFHVPLFVETAARRAPVDPADALYETRKHQPVVTPGGEPVTLQAFEAVHGRVSVACVDGGVRVKLNMEGLIPNGVYSIWIATFGPQGFDPAAPERNRVGLGALGARDGSESFFVASAAGTGTLAATTPAGPLSTFGEIGACPLTETGEWHVVGAYHIDGQTHGPEPGPLGTFVEQFAFRFDGDSPP